MTSFGIGLIVFACVFGGALAGMFLGRVLPPHHLGDETKSVVTLASGTLSVLSALVIGLLISYAKGDFDAQTKLVQKFAADLILLDRVMLQYGPETGEARDLLRRYTALKIDLTWPEENAADGARPDEATALAMLESILGKLLGLTPQDEAQRWLQSRACRSAVTCRGALAAGGSKRRFGPAALSRRAGVLADHPVRCLRPVCPTPCHRRGSSARLRAFPVRRDLPDPGDGSTL